MKKLAIVATGQALNTRQVFRVSANLEGKDASSPGRIECVEELGNLQVLFLLAVGNYEEDLVAAGARYACAVEESKSFGQSFVQVALLAGVLEASQSFRENELVLLVGLNKYVGELMEQKLGLNTNQKAVSLLTRNADNFD